ncbi:MAG: response regulator [Halanaerobiales bacterium]
MYSLLIVEDEKPIREKMANNIDWEENDYRVYFASNGKEALTRLEKSNIDILVTDIKMPKINGIELVKKARKINKNIKVIIISGHAEFEYAQESIRLGVNDYLLKPFRSPRLLDVVNKTRKKINEENRQKEEIVNIRKEIDEYLKKNKLHSSLNWLTDDNFFRKQSSLVVDNKVFQLLKTGSKQELEEELEKLFTEIDNYRSERQKYLLLINGIILNIYQTMKELGYEFVDLMQIIDYESLKQIESMNMEEVKKWLSELFYKVNYLVSFKKDKRNEKLVQKVKDYMINNFSEGITLNDMAKRFSISTGYLSKIFLEQVGENFLDYLNMIRVNKAKELLKTTDKKIYEVADEVGFNDSYYFSSWFKKIVGVTPTTYRDNLDLL